MATSEFCCQQHPQPTPPSHLRRQCQSDRDFLAASHHRSAPCCPRTLQITRTYRESNTDSAPQQHSLHYWRVGTSPSWDSRRFAFSWSTQCRTAKSSTGSGMDGQGLLSEYSSSSSRAPRFAEDTTQPSDKDPVVSRSGNIALRFENTAFTGAFTVICC